MKRYLVSLIVCFLFLGEGYSAKRIVVGVSEFENLTKDRRFDWLSTGIPESLTTDLAEIKSIQVVEKRKKVIDALSKFIAISDVKLGNIIGANILVVGSFQIIGKQIRIDAKFVNVETGQIMASEKFQGKTEKIFDLYPQIVLTLAKNLGIEVVSPERERIEKPETQYVKAYEKVALAKRVDYHEKNRKKANKEIKKLTKEALKIDPNYEKARRLFEMSEALFGRSFITEGEYEGWGMLLTIEQLPYTTGISNSQYVANSREQSQQINSSKLLYGVKFVNFTGDMGFGFGFDFSPTFRDEPTSAKGIECGGAGVGLEAFHPLVQFGGRIFLIPGIGINAGFLGITQKYAYPPNEKWVWTIRWREYVIDKKGVAHSEAPYIMPKVFMTVGVLPTKDFAFIFDIGYKVGIKDSNWEWYTPKDFNGDGKIDENTECVQIKREWLQYRNIELGGLYYGIAIRYWW